MNSKNEKSNGSEIIIPDAKHLSCPSCGSTYLIENTETKERLFRQVSLVYIDSGKGIIKLKCRQCRSMIQIKT
jgi:transposase-like protein